MISCTRRYGTEDRKSTVPVCECVLSRHCTGTIPIILYNIISSSPRLCYVLWITIFKTLSKSPSYVELWMCLKISICWLFFDKMSLIVKNTWKHHITIILYLDNKTLFLKNLSFCNIKFFFLIVKIIVETHMRLL